MKFLLKYFLALLARAILRKYRPTVIAITGSVGKTSVKDAVACVLSRHFSVGATPKNLNTEIGVPVAIIGGHGLDARLFFRALRLLVARDASYPRILVLEFGADKPGDIGYLARLARPHGVMLTAVAPAHLEGFKTVDAIAREKRSIYAQLSARDWIVGNADAPETLPESHCPARRFLFSERDERADMQISRVRERLSFEHGKRAVGVSFHVRAVGQEAVFELIDVIGRHSVAIAAYAIGTGVMLGIPLEAIAHSLVGFRMPNGRMRPFEGVQKTLIIDDTYNASPSAMKLAFDVLLRFEIGQSARRWAVLGDMFDLGEQSDALHEDVGAYAARTAPDMLVCVGPKAAVIADAAVHFGLDEHRILRFDDPIVAGRAIRESLTPGDIVLVKGSQGIRLEKCVKVLMADPVLAKDLLVRQDWKK